MPVERPDPAADADEPGRHVPPDGPQPSDDHGPSDAVQSLPPDPAHGDAVRHAHRVQVERIYAAHRENTRDAASNADADTDRGSWAEALPSLRAAWEEHEARYPERERATPLTHM